MIGTAMFVLTLLFAGAVFFYKKVLNWALGGITRAPQHAQSLESALRRTRWFLAASDWLSDIVTRGGGWRRPRRDGDGEADGRPEEGPPPGTPREEAPPCTPSGESGRSAGSLSGTDGPDRDGYYTWVEGAGRERPAPPDRGEARGVYLVFDRGRRAETPAGSADLPAGSGEVGVRPGLRDAGREEIPPERPVRESAPDGEGNGTGRTFPRDGAPGGRGGRGVEGSPGLQHPRGSPEAASRAAASPPPATAERPEGAGFGRLPAPFPAQPEGSAPVPETEARPTPPLPGARPTGAGPATPPSNRGAGRHAPAAARRAPRGEPDEAEMAPPPEREG